MGLNNEVLEKAKQADTAEELMAVAKENGVELTEEEAKSYFEQLHRSGELSDEELDNVAGGACVQKKDYQAKDGRMVVTVGYCCDHFVCEYCGATRRTHHCSKTGPSSGLCDTCKYMSYERGLWLCNNEKNMK